MPILSSTHWNFFFSSCYSEERLHFP
jgi:hypothetical protein